MACANLTGVIVGVREPGAAFVLQREPPRPALPLVVVAVSVVVLQHLVLQGLPDSGRRHLPGEHQPPAGHDAGEQSWGNDHGESTAAGRAPFHGGQFLFLCSCCCCLVFYGFLGSVCVVLF